MNIHSRIKVAVIIVTTLVLFGCSSPNNAGAGSSSSGNALVAGTIYNAEGDPEINARVSIIPVDYNPRRDGALSPVNMTMTDRTGTYSFPVVDSGTYNILAVGSDQKNTLIQHIHLTGEPVNVPADTLHIPGVVRIMFPGSIDPNVYAYIPGTTLGADASSAQNNSFIIGRVPAGSFPAISIMRGSAAIEKFVDHDVIVNPDDTTILVDPAWPYKMRLILNTTPSGANILGTVTNFPVTIFLNTMTFNFSQTMASGAGLRFMKPDGTLLPYEIEHWDSLYADAEISVKVDTILGNNDSQHFFMYWGNPNVVGGSDGTKVFDTSDGFQGVWHLKGAITDTAYDATANRYHGIPHFSRIDFYSPVNIGRPFNGSGCIVMPQTTTGKLDIQPGDAYTISAWVFVQMPDTVFRVIAGNENGRYCLDMRGGFDSRWEMVAFIDSAIPQWKSVADNKPIIFNNWTNIVGVCRGSDRYLFVNGTQVPLSDYAAENLPITPRKAGRNFSIGGFLSDSPDSQNFGYFDGYISEVQFSNVARSADWIKLSYNNKRFMSSFVKYMP